MSVDAKLDALLNDPQTPDSLKADLLKAALERDTARAAQDHETRRAKWSTPLIIALTGLITMAGNLGVGYFTGIYETSNAVTLETLQSELDARTQVQNNQLTQELERLKAELAEKANNAAALQQLRAREREFQYKMLEQQLALKATDLEVADDELAQRRAQTLLFLVDIGALSELKADELRRYADKKDVPALVISGPTSGPDDPDDRIQQMRAVAAAPVEAYPALFEQYRGDELLLGTLGKAAFRNEAHDWTIRALEQAKLVESSKVWQGSYPYLIGAYMLEGRREDAAVAMDEMFGQIKADYGYLTWPSQISNLMRDFGSIREAGSLPDADRSILSKIIGELEEILIEKQGHREKPG